MGRGAKLIPSDHARSAWLAMPLLMQAGSIRGAMVAVRFKNQFWSVIAPTWILTTGIQDFNVPAMLAVCLVHTWFLNN